MTKNKIKTKIKNKAAQIKGKAILIVGADLIEVNNTTAAEINIKKLKLVITKFIQVYKQPRTAVSVAIVGDKVMTGLNKAYRGQNKPTDVLSFSDLNEIIIDYAQIKRQAQELGKKAENELIFILVHGLLHLIGYDDQTEKSRLAMIKLGDDFLKKCAIIKV